MRKHPRSSTLATVVALLAGAMLVLPACDKAKGEGSDDKSAEADKPKTKPLKKAEPEAARPKPTPAKPAPAKEAPPAGDLHPALTDPSQASETAPETYRAKFETTKGDFVIEVTRKWAPRGADRFYNLVKVGFFDNVKFFRVVEGFMVQFGIHGNPEVSSEWRNARIEDDIVAKSNTRGMVTFATAGPNTRTTQVFVNFVDRNTFLDKQGFSPFGKVVEGMKVVDALEGKYREAPSRMQGMIQQKGNAFLDEKFPGLDSIKKASIVEAAK